MYRFIRRLLCLLTALCLLCACSSAFAQSPSSVQIRSTGGLSSADGVTLSKTIQGTAQENLFDITLEVTTPFSLETLRQAEDAAVVMVMDISGTMNQKLQGATGPSRLDAAKDAAAAFINAFCSEDKLLGAQRQLGFVAFHQDAQTVFALENATPDMPSDWIPQIRSMIAPPSGANGKGWTNIEAGLQLAHNLLSSSSAAHRFIILLSDGFPTTYISSDRTGRQLIEGYNPTKGFYDHVKNVECSGTSYSETGARRARAVADAIKQSGIDIFSIGVGLGSPIEVPAQSGNWVPETIQAHIDRINWNGSVVERPKEAAKPGYVYEIGQANDPDSYRRWLGGKNGGIGGGTHFAQSSALQGPFGAYADANDAEALNNAFDTLLEEIEQINISAIRDTWIASDPMGEDVAFEGFLQPGGHAVAFENNTLRWDLQSSPFTASTQNGATLYTYRIAYRVRLQNERASFRPAAPGGGADEPAYPTNGTAFLRYRVETNGHLSPEKELPFATPEVEGYLGTLRFTKLTTETGGAHAGVRFLLSHDESGCPECGGSVTIAPLAGISDENGAVIISRIPSGHRYTLTENGLSGYETRAYPVTVSYGITTLFGADGQPADTIVNQLKPDSLTLSARKLMDGLPPEDGAFTFELLDASGRVLQTQTNQTGGLITFEPLIFRVPGEYVYRVREAAGDDIGILYDGSVYTLTIWAQKTQSGCKAHVSSIQGPDGRSEEGIVFRNRTRPPATGDDSNPALWLMWMGLAGAVAILLSVWRRQRKE